MNERLFISFIDPISLCNLRYIPIRANTLNLQQIRNIMFGKLFKKTDYKALLEGGAVIIDVRNPGEYKSGAIPGSENIPLPKLSSRIKQIKSLEVPVICVCASGMRSGTAKAQLKAAGVDAYNGGPWTKMIPYVD